MKIILLSLVCALLVTVAHAGAPRMIDALDALRRAKTSADPYKELTVAAKNLRFAKRGRVGYRAEALAIVESAISTRPDKITLDRMIDEAIAKAERGAAIHPGRRR